MKQLKRIPFCPVPVDKARRIAKKFYFMAERASKLSPKLELTLKQARMPFDGLEYVSIALFSATFMSVLILSIMLAFSSMVVGFSQAFLISLLVGMSLFIVILIYLLSYPKLLVKKRVRDMDKFNKSFQRLQYKTI